jgi:hypothetical protein
MRTLGDGILSENDFFPTTEGQIKNSQLDQGHLANNDDDMNHDINDDNISHDNFLAGNMLQLLHIQKFVGQYNSKTQQVDARRPSLKKMSSDGPCPMSNIKLKCSPMIDSNQSGLSSSISGNNNVNDTATAPTNQKVCSPLLKNCNMTILPPLKQPRSASTLTAKCELIMCEELLKA